MKGNEGSPPYAVMAVLVVALAMVAIPLPGSVSADNVATKAEGYIGYDEMTDLLQGLEADHPDIARLYPLATTYEGRTVWAMKVSDNVGLEEDEPAVLYMGGHHGNELISVEVPLSILVHVLDGYETNGSLGEIVDGTELWFVPMVNPDGREYSLATGQGWRKNRRPIDLNGDGDLTDAGEGIGVDINRNYDQNWGTEGTSHNAADTTYCGPEPFSEVESRAVRDLALAQDLTLSMSFHSYGQKVYYPWGNTIETASPQRQLLENISSEIAERNGYAHLEGNEDGDYPTSGDSDDWLYNHTGCLPFTVELTTVFAPPEEMISYICGQNLESSLYISRIAGDPGVSLLPDWTFMVYMAGDNSLAGEALDDLNEMEAVGSTDDVNVVVLYDGSGYGDSRLYRVENDPAGFDPAIVSQPIDDGGAVIPPNGEAAMDQPGTLSSFMAYVMDVYPAQRYALDLWNHGKGIFTGVCQDVTSGGWLEVTEIWNALHDASALPCWRDLDIVGFDACRMGHTEIARTLSPYASFMVASEDDEPEAGWRYDAFLDDLALDPNLGPRELAGLIVGTYLAAYPYTNYVTQAATDLWVLEHLTVPRLDAFARTLRDYIYDYNQTIRAARSSAETFKEQPDNPDFYDFVENVVAEQALPYALRDRGQELLITLELAVVEEGHGSLNTGAHGLGIYLPESAYNTQYEPISASDDWSRLVRAYLDPVYVPHIYHEPLADPQLGAAPFAVEATVIDDDLDGSRVYMHYSVDGGAYVAVQMSGDEGHFAASTSELRDGALVRYYLSAVDLEGNAMTLPYDTSDNEPFEHFSFTVRYPDDIEVLGLRSEPASGIIEGELVMFYADVVNNGIQPLYGLNVSLYRNGTSELVRWRSADVEPGQSLEVPFWWYAEQGGEPLSTFTVLADPWGEYMDVDRSNNVASITIRIDMDMDGDGIGDSEDGDIDGDGIPNDWEDGNGLDDTDPGDASGDPDLDGLDNLGEFLHGTGPWLNDTDNDSIPDGWEVAHGIDPTNSTDAGTDPDGDGSTYLDDYLEGLVDDEPAPSDPVDDGPTDDDSGSSPDGPLDDAVGWSSEDLLRLLAFTAIACVIGATLSSLLVVYLVKRRLGRP